jgi:hypothetical protein
MTRLRIFIGLVFRRNGYDFIFWPLFAWGMAGTLAQHSDDWRRIT